MKIADYKRPSDWELFFKHRTNYIPLKLLEQKYNISIDFTTVRIPSEFDDIDGSKDLIVLNLKEQFALTEAWDYFIKKIDRPLEDIVILSDSIYPGSLFDLHNPNFCFAGTWFESPVNMCTQTIGPKKYLFDFLVGYRETELDYLYDSFEQRGLLNKNNLYNYWKGNNPDFADMDHPFAEAWRNLPKFEKGFGVDEENAIDIDVWASEFGTDSVCLHNAWTSRIVPIEAYQQSLFTVNRETKYFWDDHLFYQPTEKSAKPMKCKRLFFTLGAQYENRNYTKLGFKVYDHDKCDWDNLKTWQDRTNAFADYISNLDQDYVLELYDKEKENIEHNYKIANQDWGQMCLNFVMNRLEIKYS